MSIRNNKQDIIRKVWEDYFSNEECGYDAFGHYIEFKEYGTESIYAWNLDHIWPKNPKTAKRIGSNNYKNLQPLCIDCNKEKGGYMSNYIDGLFFSIESAGTTFTSGEERMIGRMIVNDEIVTAY